MQEITANPPATIVKAGINERQLFTSLQSMFASSYSMLGELLQNARRAGASRVDVTVGPGAGFVSFQDDGHGIDDFQNLVTLAQSGWREEVVQDDRPFGVGLFSVLFAAEKISFRSNGRRLDLTLEDVVERRELIVVDDDGVAHGTRVELHETSDKLREARTYRTPLDTIVIEGAKDNHQFELVEQLRFRAEGFPIPILVNGIELPRPFAKANIVGVETDIGFVSIPGVHTPGEIEQMSKVYFLQGLPIERSRSRYHHRHIVVHLDNGRFTPRMPDRSHLQDSEPALREIGEVVLQVTRDYLEARKQAMRPSDFVLAHWDDCFRFSRQDLLSDIPFIPRASVVGGAPVICYREGWNETQAHPGIVRDGETTPDEVISRDDIESGRVKLWLNMPGYVDSDTNSAAAVLLTLADRFDLYTVNRVMPDEHWIHDTAVDAQNLDIVVEPVNAAASAPWTGLAESHENVAMQLVDAVKVKVSAVSGSKVPFVGEYTISDHFVLAPRDIIAGSADRTQDAMVFLPPSDESQYPIVDALSGFYFDDSYDENWRDREADLWHGIEGALRGATLASNVQAALNQSVHSPLQQHAGQFAIVSVQPDGVATYLAWTTRPGDDQFLADVALAFDRSDRSLTTAERLKSALHAVLYRSVASEGTDGGQ